MSAHDHLRAAVSRVFEVHRDPEPDPLMIEAALRQLAVYEEVTRLNNWAYIEDPNVAR